MKKKCKPRCKPKYNKPKSWLNKIDFMAGFLSLGIACLCGYTMASVILFGKYLS